jgi:hypothetical protein
MAGMNGRLVPVLMSLSGIAMAGCGLIQPAEPVDPIPVDVYARDSGTDVASLDSGTTRVDGGGGAVDGGTTPPEPKPVPQTCADMVSVVDGAPGGGTPPISTYQGQLGKEEVVAIGVYTSRAPGATIRVEDTRMEPHVLLLSAYDAVTWTIGGGGNITRVYLAGYTRQSLVANPAIAVTNDSGDVGGQRNSFSCTYAIPSNGQGCGTQVLEYAQRRIGSPVTFFGGTYAANQFSVKGCAAPTSMWTKSAFDVSSDVTSGCGGAHYVRFNAQYNKWIGAVLCKPDEYKLYLAEREAGPYHPMADVSGGGDDHCELVNPNMRMRSTDAIDPATCSGCGITAYKPWSWPGDVPVYTRAGFGDPFVLRQWPRSNDGAGNPISSNMTAASYRCGVSIPQ